jgi:DNA polymerase I-like protein with 3'-5' exonuclease and polymerase domains
VIDVHPDETNKVIFLLDSINKDMKAIINQQFKIDFNVPLLLEAKIGDNWLDTKDVS